jgi:hypothetical protein
MKRSYTTGLALAAALGIAACGGQTSDEYQSDAAFEADPFTTPEMNAYPPSGHEDTQGTLTWEPVELDESVIVADEHEYEPEHGPEPELEPQQEAGEPQDDEAAGERLG